MPDKPGKRVILHIGFHKTGSSAIQAHLTACAPAYARRGLLIPPGLSEWIGHPEIAWVCSQDQMPWADRHFAFSVVHEYYQILIEQMPANTTMVLSSEEFCRLNYYPGAIDAVRAFLEDAEVTVIAYVRDPLDFLVSRYRHEVAYDEVLSLRDYLIRNLASADFPTRLAPWVAAFGENRVNCRRYDRSTFPGGSIVNDFMAATGVAAEASTTSAGEFGGAHPWLCEAWRELNHRGVDQPTLEASRAALHLAGQALPAVAANEFLLRNLDLREIEGHLANVRAKMASMA